jgi:hypothetical protein
LVCQRSRNDGRTVPDFKFPIYWLYIRDRDVLHLTQAAPTFPANRLRYLGQESQATQGFGGHRPHRFPSTGLEDMIGRFERLGIAFTERQVNNRTLYQLFPFDPNGMKVELNFAAAEAKGREAPVTASLG